MKEKEGNHSFTLGCLTQERRKSITAETAEIAECTARTAVRAVPLLCALRVLCGETTFCHLPP